MVTRAPYLVSRLQGFGTTIFAEMSALAAQTGALNLGQGFPDTDGPTEVSEAAIEAIRQGQNQYPPGPGVQDLRNAIAEHQKRFWDIELDPQREILVTAGATEALAAALLGLCETGDEVVVFDPTYDSYAAGIALAGARLRGVLLRPSAGSDGSFGFDPDELRRAFNPKTRLILLNTPHNPTGKVFTEEELALVAELCIEHDVLAVTDEVYEHLVFEGGTHHPLAGFDGMAERTLTISSGGKSFSFTGWKIGWACGPAQIINAVKTAKQFLTFVSGAPFQPAIAVGLRLGDGYFDRFVGELQAKRDLLGRYLTEAGFDVFTPEGTYFTTVDITPVGGTDSIDFCLGLPERAGVVAVPSAVFYQDRHNGKHLVRFCFAKQDGILIDAGQRLVTAFA
ncbi:MAG: pyridoxal phosphate-dependent aminotransferase [Actinomycetia bacterium]|nr:pyridoxal phosphate-dependent aminotransferase [Actinomycetes bacterium]MCP5033735.1 pyridoxal phosphate-dependent aminotransferase [Actinomycetes bacterium]